MTASLLEPAAREWKEALQQAAHDMYHEPAYVDPGRAAVRRHARPPSTTTRTAGTC